MEYHFSKRPMDEYHTVTIRGVFASEELIDMVEALWKSPEYLSATHILWDFSQTQSNCYFEDIFKFSQFVKENKHDHTLIAFAIVAPQDNEYGISRIYAGLSEVEKPVMKVFRDIKNAQDWLLQQHDMSEV